MTTVTIRNTVQKTITGLDFNFKGFTHISVSIAPLGTRSVKVPLPSDLDSLYVPSYWTILFSDRSASPISIKKVGQNIVIDVDQQNLVWKLVDK